MDDETPSTMNNNDENSNESSSDSYKNILSERLEISDYFENIITKLSQKKWKEKLKTMRSLCEYLTTFGTDSAQGTAGIIKLKNNENNKVVFKVSNCVDFSIEHESIVLEQLNKIAKYCPHFMYKFGDLDLPISANYFTKEGKKGHGVLQEPKILATTPILFTEFISKYTFYHAIKGYDKNVISSLLIQVLTALKISQVKCDFTHYDLHMDNILVRECDPNLVHLYILPDGDIVFVPTYGLIPVIIDMGSAHSKGHKRMLSSSENYECGLQATSFDRLADVHHLLLSTFSCLEKYMPVFEKLMLKLALMFHPLPVWKEKGWKILFHRLNKAVKYIIRDKSKLIHTGHKDDRENYSHIFEELFEDFLAILNGAISLPFETNKLIETDSDKFEDLLISKFDAFFKHFVIMLETDSINSDQDCLYVLKEIVNATFKINQPISKEEKDKALSQLRIKLLFVMKDHDLKKIKINDFIKSIHEFGKVIGSLYKFLEQEHNDFIEDVYQECPGDITEFIKFFRQNIPPECELSNKTIIHIYDTQAEKFLERKLNISKKELEELNKMSLKSKGLFLQQHLIK
jgi:hypothetical protein